MKLDNILPYIADIIIIYYKLIRGKDKIITSNIRYQLCTIIKDKFNKQFPHEDELVESITILSSFHAKKYYNLDSDTVIEITYQIISYLDNITYLDTSGNIISLDPFPFDGCEFNHNTIMSVLDLYF